MCLFVFVMCFFFFQFTASATERELNAIDSEDVKDRTSDFWRGLLIENIRHDEKYHPAASVVLTAFSETRQNGTLFIQIVTVF